MDPRMYLYQNVLYFQFTEKRKCNHNELQDLHDLSRPMGKTTICICENKGADQLRSNCEARISAFVFATRIVHSLFFLNPKFQASSSFLCLYRSVCVGPVRKPHCWFSHEAAHLCFWISSP